MTLDEEKMQAAEAQKYFNEVCVRHHWTLRDLAEEAGYSLATLQKATRAGTKVFLTEKMRSAIERASILASQRGIVAEHMEASGGKMMVTLLEAGKPPQRLMFKHDPTAEDVILREVEELLGEIPDLPPKSKKLAITRVVELMSKLLEDENAQRR